MGRVDIVDQEKSVFLYMLLILFYPGRLWEKPVVSSQSSGNPEYENQKITEGEIGETKDQWRMRQLPQKEIQRSFQRTTGMVESFKVAGPTFNDVLVQVGIDVQDFKGIGFIAKDGYYCLVTPEIIENRR